MKGGMIKMFKRRTNESVEFDIDVALRETERRKKVLEILEREEKTRMEKEAVTRKIKEIKSRRPSFIKSAFKKTATGIGHVQRFAEKRTSAPVRKATPKRRVVKRKAPKRRTTRRVTPKRRMVRKAAPTKNWYESTI